jgi:hypothetical protein
MVLLCQKPLFLTIGYLMEFLLLMALIIPPEMNTTIADIK